MNAEINFELLDQAYEKNKVAERLFALLLQHQLKRESSDILIASESIADPRSIAAQLFGYDLDKETADRVEELAEERFKHVFNREGDHDLRVDLRPPSGAAVNLQMWSMLSGGEPVKAFCPDLKYGFGHLTHGAGEMRVVLGAILGKDSHFKFLDILGEYGFEWSDPRNREEVRLEQVMEALVSGDTSYLNNYESEVVLQTVAIKEFLNDLYYRDRAKFDEIVSKAREQGILEEHESLLEFVVPGNPTAVNQLHYVNGYRALDTGHFDYDQIAEDLRSADPPYEVIIIGGSANPRDIDYKKVIDAAKETNTLVWLDCAHYTGLIAGGVMDDPILAGVDIITTTTHKSPRGVKGAGYAINYKNLKAKADKGNKKAQELLAKMDDEDRPRFERDTATLAAHAAMCKYLASEENREFSAKVVENAKALAEKFKELGWNVLTDGTESHIVLLNCKKTYGIDGDLLAKACDHQGIVLNKNGIPGDTGTAFKPDGVRLGTIILTQLCMSQNDVVNLAVRIDSIARKLSEYDGPDHELAFGNILGPPAERDLEVKVYHNELLRDYENLLRETDPELAEILTESIERNINDLVARTRMHVQLALQNKYAEGLPGKRFYEGNEFIDLIEQLVNKVVLDVFAGGDSRKFAVNTQGSNVEMSLLAVLRTLVKPKAKVVVVGSDIYLGAGLVANDYDLSVLDSLNSFEKVKDADVLMVDVSCLDEIKWSNLSAYAAENGIELIACSSSRASGLIDGEVHNPLVEDQVSFMITDSKGLAEGVHSAPIIYNKKRVQAILGEKLDSVLKGDIDFAVFPGTIGGPDLVSMVVSAFALSLRSLTVTKKL